MGFEINRATAARFDDVATILAPKKPDAQGCWCLSYRFEAADNEALKAPHRAEEVARLCRRRRSPGVLAYDGDEVVGWAGIAPRSELVGLHAERFPGLPDADPWVIFCFRVRAGNARRGIARALLDGAVEYAFASAAPAVLAYPIDAGGDKIDRTQASAGLQEWFTAAGFEVIGDTGYQVSGHPRVVVCRRPPRPHKS